MGDVLSISADLQLASCSPHVDAVGNGKEWEGRTV